MHKQHLGSQLAGHLQWLSRKPRPLMWQCSCQHPKSQSRPLISPCLKGCMPSGGLFVYELQAGCVQEAGSCSS